MTTEYIVNGCVLCPFAHDSMVYEDAKYCKANEDRIPKKYFMEYGIAPKWCPLPLELKQEGKRK